MENVKREKIVNKIVDDFTECRLSSYWFSKSETQIEWSTHQEVYLIYIKIKLGIMLNQNI